MNAQDLKSSILQRAIEGKLVPQRQEEGTAKELLAEIRAEKARLVKEKKIKKSKPLPEITDEEKPFDIPESWEWVRLDDICKSISDGDHQAPPKSEKGVPFLVISDVRSGKLNFKNTRHVPVEYFKTLSPERIPLKGDILFTVTGSYGIPVLINVDMEFCFQRHIALLKPMIEYTFLLYMLESPFIKKQCDAVATGTAQKTVGLKSLKSLLLPLPPLYEQGRIITKIEELQPNIDAYDKAKTKLQAIEQRFPEAMKKSLLQYAIEGKLVPQRKEEGTAKELLAEIRAEKARLVKEKKIKKSKPFPEITDEETPFDIPESWEWVRIGELFSLQAGKNIKATYIYHEQTESHVYPCYGGNGVRGFVEFFNSEGDFPIIGRQGALCGNINRAKGKFYATEHAVLTTTFANTDVSWACYFLKALNLNQYATATAQPGLAVSKINQVLIPLPPLAEQHRIVAKLEELLPLCQQLAANP